MRKTLRSRAARHGAPFVVLWCVLGCSPGGESGSPETPLGFVNLNTGSEGGVLEHGAARLLVPPGAAMTTQGFSLDDDLESFVEPLGERASRPFAVRIPGGLQLPVELDLSVSKGVDLADPSLRVVVRSTVDGSLSQMEGTVDRSARTVRVRLLRPVDVQLALLSKVTPLRLGTFTTQRLLVGAPAAQDPFVTQPSGGSGWVRVAGDLPPGMFLDSRGAFSGTPSLAGRYPVGVTWETAGTRGETVFVLVVTHMSNPVPTVMQLAPTDVGAGERSFMLDVTGNDFVPGSVVLFGDVALPTTYVAPYWLRARVPAALVVEPGVRPVSVRNPQPGGGSGTALEFVVRPPPPNGVRAEIVNVEPVPLIAGSTNVELTVTVNNRTFDAVVVLSSLAGGTHVLEPASSTGTWVRVLVPDALLAQPGQLAVIVRNSPNTNAIDSVTWDVPILAGSTDGGTPDGGWTEPERNPLPSATEANPALVEQYASSAPVAVTGTGFLPTTRVRIDGQLVSTEYEGPTQVIVTIPAEFLGRARSLTLYPENPPLGGGAGPGVRVEVVAPAVTPLPTLGEVVPTSVHAPADDKLLDVYGARFAEGAQVAFDGAALPTRRLSDTHLRATLRTTQALAAGTHALTVVNPGAPARTSASVNLFVLGAGRDLPVLGPLARTEVMRGADVRLTLTGAGFVPGSTRVLANDQLVSASFQSDRAGQVVLPAEALENVDSVVLRLRDGEGAPMADTRTVRVVPYRPLAREVSPSNIVAGSGAVAVTVTLDPTFVPSTTPEVLSGPRPLRVIHPLAGNRMTVELPADLLVRPAVLRLKVRDGQALSDELLVGVDTTSDTGLPRLDTIEPANVERGVATTVTLRGSLFPNAGQVLIGTRRFPFTSANTTSIQLALSASDLDVAGSYGVVVSYDSNAIGASSADRKLTVTGSNPTPSLTRATPSIVAVGSSDTVVTLEGANFLPRATSIYAGSTRLGTCELVGYDCRVTVPKSLLAQATTLSLSAQNPEPGGGWSTPVALPVQNGNAVPRWGSFAHPLLLPASSTAVNLVLPLRNIHGGTRVIGPLDTQLVIVDASAHALGVRVPSEFLPPASSLLLVAKNDPPLGGSTPSQWFNVSRVPVVTSIEPSVFPAGTGPVAVTLTGSGFHQEGGSLFLRIDDTRIVSVSPGSDGVATATLPANAIPARGFAELRLFYEGGFESNAVTVLVP